MARQLWRWDLSGSIGPAQVRCDHEGKLAGIVTCEWMPGQIRKCSVFARNDETGGSAQALGTISERSQRGEGCRFGRGELLLRCLEPKEIDKRCLAGFTVLAGSLADSLGRALDVEDVVGNLERITDVITKRAERLALRRAGAAEAGAGLTGKTDQRPGLHALQMLDVGSIRGFRLAEFVALQVEALTADHTRWPGRPGERSHQLRSHRGIRMGALPSQQFECERQQRIAHQNGGPVVECSPYGWFAAAKSVIVHRWQVVVNERIAMYAFERRRRGNRAIAADAEQTGGLHDQERAKALATAERGMSHAVAQAHWHIAAAVDFRCQKRFGQCGIAGKAVDKRRRCHVLAHRTRYIGVAGDEKCRLRPRTVAPPPARPRTNRMCMLSNDFPATNIDRRATAAACAVDALYFGALGLLAAAAAFAVVTSALALTIRFVNPPTSAFMLRHGLAGGEIAQTWVPLDRISPHVVRAVIASEDAGFCRHGGVAWGALGQAVRAAERNRSLNVPGASTISMQVIKNLFLWRERSLLRKGLEVAMTPVMEFYLPKRRILEIYLNIAEWGSGIFGAEQAARHHFSRPASRLNRQQAALLAAALPNPRLRRAGRPGPGTRRSARRVLARAEHLAASTACVRAAK